MKKELAPKDELNKLDAYSAEEIKEVSSKTFEQSPSNTFKRDGILTEKLIVNGVDTKTVLIQDTVNKGSWMASNQYRVMPHGRVLKIVKAVGDELGIKMTPVEQPAMKMGYKTLKDGSVIAKDGRYMLASFTANRDVEVKSNDIIKTGFTVVNTMDTSTSLHIVPFTLRMNCMNQFHAFMTSVKEWSGNYTSPMVAKAKEAFKHSIKLQTTYKELPVFLEKLRKRQTHSSLLTEATVATKVALNLELAVGFANDFKTLDKINLVDTEQQIQNLVDSMPVSVNKELSCITIDRVSQKKEPKVKPIHAVDHIKYSKSGVWNNIDYKKQVTHYDLFNDYTNILTHKPDVASSSMIRQLTRHKKLASGLRFGSLQPMEVKVR